MKNTELVDGKERNKNSLHFFLKILILKTHQNPQ